MHSSLFLRNVVKRNANTPIESSITTADASTKGGKPDGGETAGNNLSFPVIWADGVTKVVPGTMGTYSLAGEWWGVWGVDPIDPQAPLYSCGPYFLPNDVPCTDAEYRAYVQKDPKNVWQAFNGFPEDFLNKEGELYVDLIDWGDNLESVDWKISSQVRVEMVLLENLETPVTQFAMRHTDSWGIDEAHGLQTDLELVGGLPVPVYGSGTQATVYSDNARFTIQKLNVDEKTDERLNLLEWEPTIGWVEPGENPLGLINDPVLNTKASAEINVKGKIIFGHTWNVRSTNDGEGYYRLTFSLDPNDNLNTFFDLDTQFVEQVVVVDDSALDAKEDDGGEDSGGGKGVIVFQDGYSLTYMDILITGKTTGNGGGGGNGGGNGGGGNSGNGGGGNH